MDDCLISKRLRKSQHTLANIISFKCINQQVIDEILCMDSFNEGDLELFDGFICKKGFEDIIENVFECFLKIAGIESVLARLLDHHCIHEKLANALTRASNSDRDVSIQNNSYMYKERPFQEFGMFKVARDTLSGAFDDSRIHILAYLICIDKKACYEGTYEVFYIIDYLVKGYIPAVQVGNSIEAPGNMENAQDRCFVEKQIGRILLNWAENCSVPFSSKLLSFDSSGFFESEILYLSDFKLLCKIIVARKSHKILLSRLCFIVNSFSCQSDDAGTYNESGTIRSLSDLLVASYSGDSKHTNEILLGLFSEALTKEFITRTGASLSSFFEICRKVDPLFVECMNLCIEHFGKVGCDTDQLQKICKSEYFRVDGFQGFQRVVRTLKERGLQVPVEKLCSATNWRRRASYGCSVATLVDDLEISRDVKCKDNGYSRPSLRQPSDNRKETIDRVIYLLQDSDAVPLKVLKECITKKHPRLSVIVMLKSGNFKLFKHGFVRLRNLKLSTSRESDDCNKEAEDGSSKNSDAIGASHAMRTDRKLHGTVGFTANASLFGKLVVEELQRLDYSKFYQRVISFLLDKGILEGHPSFSDPSPFALALLSKFRTGPLDTSRPEEKLTDGLYFYKSSLRLSKLYKKFVFGCKVSMYSGCLMDMPILRFGEGMSIEVCCGDIVCIKGEEQRVMAQLKDCYVSDNGVRSMHLAPNSRNSFGMIYGSEMGPGRFSVTDVKGTGALLEHLEIRISVVFDRESAIVSLNEGAAQKFTIGETPFIEISEKFYGVLKDLFYAETNEMGPPPIAASPGKSGMDKFYDEYINPIEKLLRYKSRKGVYIDALKPFYLSSSSRFVRMDNIIEYRNAGNVEFYN